MRARVTLVFRGRFVPESFAAFMRHRAERLSITIRPRGADTRRIEVEVEGERDLVDMFEMACSLGPLDCLVLEVERLASETA